MPIQTRGFGVDVMPQYTGADPRMVAFNPMAISDGAMTAFQLARMREEQLQRRALMEELNATRQGRIEAQNIGNRANVTRDLSFMNLAPSEEALKMGRIGSEMQNMPLQTGAQASGYERTIATNPSLTTADIAGAGLRTAEANAMTPIMPELAAEKKAQALAGTAEAESNLALSGLKRQTMESKMNLEKLHAELQASAAPAENVLHLEQVYDAIENAQTDAELKRGLQAANILLAKAHAGYFEAGGSGSKETVEQRIARLQGIYKNLMASKDSTGQRSTDVYQGETYEIGPDGSPQLKKSGIPFFKSPVQTDKIGESNLQAARAIQNEIYRLQKSIAPTAEIDINQPAVGGGAKAPTQKNLPPLEIKGIRRL